jgi:hypothetical protein
VSSPLSNHGISSGPPTLLLLLAAAAAGCATAPPPCPPTSQGIQGRLCEGRAGKPMTTAGPHVVLARGERDAPVDAPPPLVWRFGDDGFAPPFLVACAAQEVWIVNDDRICHRFFASLPPNDFDLGMLRPGESRPLRFGAAGTVHVYCSLHGGRQATILVAPTPYYALASAAGEFAIQGLPPGRYELETWSEDRPPERLEVTVPESGTPFVEIVVAAPAARPPR